MSWSGWRKTWAGAGRSINPMSENSGIAWTDHTFNPWWGCEKISPGCKHCYAESFARRTGTAAWGDAPRRFFGDKHWAEPLKWDREAGITGRRAKVFCASMADAFEDRRDLDPHRARLWDLIDRTPSLDWLLLTKRPENAAVLAPPRWADRWPENAWFGVTVENQEQANRRIPIAFTVPAAVRFVSHEPALEFVEFFDVDGAVSAAMDDRDLRVIGFPADMIDWIIVGGESGAGHRVMPLECVDRTVRSCRDAGVSVFVKQDSGMYPGRWGRIAEEFRVREFPR